MEDEQFSGSIGVDGYIRIGTGKNQLTLGASGGLLQVNSATQLPKILAPVASGCQPTSSTAAASGSFLGTNSRKQHYSPIPLSELRLSYGNFYNNNGQEDDSLVGDVAVDCAIEYPAGVYTPVYFQGKRVVTINPGGVAESDPVSVPIPANTQFFTRSYMQISSTTLQFPILGPAVQAQGEQAISETLANQDKTISGTITGGGYGFPPMRIRHLVARGTLVLGAVGDSIITGSGDTTDVYRGWFGIATAGVVCVQKVSLTSNRASFEASAVGRYRRWQLLENVNVAIDELGINDLSNSRTLAQIQADLLTVWQALNARGIKVWRTTIFPQTTSTDSWATTANQTVRAWETTRVSLNTWIRDGAPLASASNLTPVASGTTAALRAGSTGHPLSGYLETANQVEANAAGALTQNGGRWRVDLAVPTLDGTHPVTVLHTQIATVLTAAIPTFQAAVLA